MKTNFLVGLMLLFAIQSIAQTRWYKYPGNPVLFGSPEVWDNVIIPKTVIYENDKFHIWYKGMSTIMIGYGHATSEDGVHWNRNDHNPLKFNCDGEPWEVWISSLDILRIDSVYHMWYTGLSEEISAVCIGYAWSTDGVNWNKHPDPVLIPSNGIAWEESGFRGIQVIYARNQYHMWYNAYSVGLPGIGRTGYASSIDGIHWNKYEKNPVLDVGDPGTWEDYASMMHAVIFNGSGFEMWYHGWNLIQHEIGYASSTDGINWLKSAQNPVVKAGEVGYWDAWLTTYPVVIRQDSIYRMWYYGHNVTIGYCGYATTSVREANAWEKSEISKSQRVIRVQVFNKTEYIKVDSLAGILSTLTGRELIDSYNKLALAFSLNDAEKSIEYAEKALSLSMEEDYPEGKAMAKYAMGNSYYVIDNYSDALSSQLEALRLIDSLGMVYEKANLFSLIAGIHAYAGSHDLSCKYYEQALRLYESYTDTAHIMTSLILLGNEYLSKGDTAKAIDAFNRRLILAKAKRDAWKHVDALEGLGRSYTGRQLDSALYYFKTATTIWDTLNSGYLPFNYMITAEAYFMAGPEYYDLAEEFYLRAHAGFGNGRQHQVRLLYDMAELFFVTARYGKSREYLRLAMNLYRNYMTKQNHQMSSFLDEKLYWEMYLIPYGEKIYMLHYRIDTALNDKDQALEHYQLATRIKDSISSQQNKRQWAMIQGQYETDRIQSQIALLEKDNELKSLNLRKSRIFLYGLVSLIMILITVAYILFRNRKIKADYKIKMEKMRAEKLSEIDSMKSRFFANISHEFRTPLTLIMGPLNNLLTRSSDKTDIKNLNLAKKYAGHLQHLINQLLAISRIESGKMKLNARETNIVKLLNVYLQAFESLGKQKNIILKFSSDKDEILVYIDREKFEQIMNNLLSNAFKFTEAGGMIEVEITQQHSPYTGNSAEYAGIKVSDTGRGIPPEHINHIFDRFYQADQIDQAYYEGSGIGLALTKELVELHSGNIYVESEAAEGSTFTILMPLGNEHLNADEIVTENPGTDELPSITSPGAGKTEALELQTELSSENNDNQSILLIVEDNADMRSHIRMYFEDDFHILEAIDGEEGYEKSTQNIPDIIVSDLMMPKMDGNELCRRIKLDERTSHIPVILLTAKASKESRIEGLETGADDFITKPFDGEELKVRVKNLIQQRQRTREVLERKLDSSQEIIKIDFSNSGITSMDEKFIQKVIAAIEKNHPDPEFNIKALCLAVGLGRIQLNRKIKALTGQTTVSFIRIFRLKHAADLINKKSGTIAEIAYDVGFNNPSYFTECFQEYFGKLPSEYNGKDT